MIKGTCLCGALEYEFTAPLDRMLHCHCSMCRKHHGAAFATFVSAPIDAFRWVKGEDNVRAYASSSAGKRFFCATCGAVGPTLMPELGLAFCPAGNLLGDPGVRPQMHMFAGSKALWHTITDDLPQHSGYPPEFGGGLGLERPTNAVQPGVVAGSCLCADVAFEASPPFRMHSCHCSRCRRGRSAAHATNAFVAIDAFRWTRGQDDIVDYKVPEARFFGIAFCARCGSDVPRASARGFFVIPAGCLDTDPGIRPQAHIFVGSKAPWYEITDTTPQFAEMSPPW
jgi:hypothetical protein